MTTTRVLCGCGFAWLAAVASAMRSTTPWRQLRGATSPILRRPCMVLEQWQPKDRSVLKRRTYASVPSVFKSVNALSNVSSSLSDPLVFGDRQPNFAEADLAGVAIRAAVTVAAFFGFPHMVEMLSPVVSSTDGTLFDEVRAGLTGSFLPGISLLFGALLSTTINILIGRQNKIEDLVNEEVAHLSTATWHIMDLWRWDAERRRKALECIWRHTDSLVFRSRYQEVLSVVQDDPVADLMHMVISVSEEELKAPTHSDKPNIDREVLNFLRGLMMELNRLRTLRLSNEGRVLPPAHFVILAMLAGLLVIGFTLVSPQPAAAAAVAAVGPEAGTAAQTLSCYGGPCVAFESRLLFTGLVFSYTLLLEFAMDLTNPFSGRFKIRKTTTTAGLIRVRADIVKALGVMHMTAYDAQLRQRRRQQLKEFETVVGQPLPDNL